MKAGRLAVDALHSARGSRGRVLAVHRRAINLRLANGDIVALLPPDTPLHPWAICIPEYEYDASRLTEGAPVAVGDRFMEIGPVSVSLEGLHIEELMLTRRLSAIPPAHAVESLERLAQDRATALRSRNQLKPPSYASFRNFAADLTSALDRFRRDCNTAPLAALVGLGVGLTPSGDDVLVGVLAALDCLTVCDPHAAARRRGLISAFPAPLESHTPRLSAQMLRAAAEGRYPEPLVALAEALARPDPEPDRTTAAARALLATGHDSGPRFLQGFAAAIHSD